MNTVNHTNRFTGDSNIDIYVPFTQLCTQNVPLFTGKAFLLESLDAVTDEFLMTWSPVGIPSVMLSSHTLEIHQSRIKVT